MGRTVRDGLFRRINPSCKIMPNSPIRTMCWPFSTTITSLIPRILTSPTGGSGTTTETSRKARCGLELHLGEGAAGLGPDTDKEIHAILVLGEEVPVSRSQRRTELRYLSARLSANPRHDPCQHP